MLIGTPHLRLSSSPFVLAESSSVNSLRLEPAKRPKAAMRRPGGRGRAVIASSSASSGRSRALAGGPSGGRIERPNAVAAMGSRPSLQLPPRRPVGAAASPGVRSADVVRRTDRFSIGLPPSAGAGPSQGAAEGTSKKRATRKGKERVPPAVEDSWKILQKEVKAMRAEHLHSMGRFDTATARLASVGQLVEATSAHCKKIADAVADLRRPRGSGTGDERARGGEVVIESDVDIVARWFQPVRVRYSFVCILVWRREGTFGSAQSVEAIRSAIAYDLTCPGTVRYSTLCELCRVLLLSTVS